MTSSMNRFDCLYRRFYRYVAAVARRRLADRSFVPDVVQDTFLQLWLHIDQFEAGSDPRPWLAVVARNRAQSLNRRPHESVLAGVDLTRGNTGLRVGGIALGVIGSVPDGTLELLWERFGIGLTFAEISSRHGVPVGTVKSRLARALRGLRPPPAAEGQRYFYRPGSICRAAAFLRHGTLQPNWSQLGRLKRCVS